MPQLPLADLRLSTSRWLAIQWVSSSASFRSCTMYHASTYLEPS
jgi:hypothetical protein